MRHQHAVIHCSPVAEAAEFVEPPTRSKVWRSFTPATHVYAQPVHYEHLPIPRRGVIMSTSGNRLFRASHAVKSAGRLCRTVQEELKPGSTLKKISKYLLHAGVGFVEPSRNTHALPGLSG